MSERRLSALFTWRSAVCESGLVPTARHIALTLSLYMNERGGSAFPGAARLASDTGLSESTVRAHLQTLVQAGWLVLVERGGRRGEHRRANSYRATTPPGTGGVTPPGTGGVVEATPPGAGGLPHRETARTPPGTGGQDVIESVIEDAIGEPAAPLSPLPGMNETPSAEVSRSPRARDPIYDALRMAWGKRPPALFGKVKRELLATYDDVTPALITARSFEAQRRWPECSPKALVNNWPDLAPQRRDAGDVAPKPSKSW